MKSGMSEFAMSQRVFSGVQPTGQMHLGNYLGALQAFARMQHTHECLFCIVDLHAITLPQNPAQLAANTRCTAAAFIAAGVDPEQAVIYPQSAVPMHTEMGWVLSCVARMGWLERMTQFKDKAGKDSERASVGLFAYPVLQAADILGFRATHVPVGEDQKQHLELARDIAARFNKEYGPSDMFPLPEPVIGGFGTRVMSLKDGQKKMSKSDPSEASRINLGDDADTIARKIRRARTDADPLPERFAQLQARPEAANLVRIFAALSAEEPDAILARFAGQGFSHFKQELAELAVESLTPVGTRFVQIMEDLTALDQTLQAGAERAHALSAPIMQDVRAKLGFWPEGALV